MKRLSKMLFVPSEVKQSVFEGFDPILCSMDVIETNFKRILNIITDFKGNDEAFVQLIKKNVIKFGSELIDELEGGF